MSTNEHSYRGIIVPADPLKNCEMRTFTHYTQLQEAIGGHFDCTAWVTTDGQQFDVWVHDEGLLLELDLNITILMMVNHFTGHVPTLVGDAVVTGGADAAGRSLDVPNEIADQLMNMHSKQRAHALKHPSTS